MPYVYVTGNTANIIQHDEYVFRFVYDTILLIHITQRGIRKGVRQVPDILYEYVYYVAT